MELVKISELPIKEITTVDAYLPIIDNVGEDIENYRISLLNLFKTGGIINVNRTYGDTNYTLQTALAVIEPTLLVNGVFITFRGIDGWELYQKELDTYVKYLNRIDNELEVGSNNPLSNDAITRMYHELLSSINNVASIPHYAITDKNGEPEFQHVTQEEKTNFVTASDFVEALIENATSITHEELLNIINNNELIPNSSYRITNYTTTTVQANTTSAAHDFDIIVTALSTNELSENASCVRKVGDAYFSNANLEAWEVKYCIHNDTTRFAWADSINGKGVIYYMKDEWNNECPYDFKNIKYLKNSVLLYTFGGTADDSLIGGCHHNTIMDYISGSVLTLNSNTFGTGCHSNTFDNACHSNTFGNDCYFNTFSIKCDSNTFGNGCYYNTFGNGFDSNVFGNDCYSNVFGDKCNTITFGDNCSDNTFGNGCDSNTFGSRCSSNTFGDVCENNTFGYSCSSITFGDSCSNNTFGANSYSNTFGNYCSSNELGNGCGSNTFGDNCSNNTFGNYCSSNTFGDRCDSNTLGNNCKYNTFGNQCQYNNFYAGNAVDAGTTKKDFIKYIALEDGCMYNNFYSSIITDDINYLQRIRIKGLENTTPTNTQIDLSTVNTNYEWVICRTSDGTLKQYCPDDSSDIISTAGINNTGTIVIDTTPNWQRVNISSGGNTLFLDYASGVLPNKNREYLLIINNATASTITLTLPTASFEKGGITYYFINSEVSVSIEAGKSIEVNVIFIFTSITTCNVRTLISQF